MARMKLQNDVLQALENYEERLLDDVIEVKELDRREKALILQRERRTIKKLRKLLRECTISKTLGTHNAFMGSGVN